ncbi:phenylalanine--tRNA ligase subunit beta [Pseudogracilibacillus auburnensis]|uniref:Phenylalanine--tRNA ligase beta subunit n=1 Tax=Pseudogracilibacillus auburnensis TaxID=1494959 RepID=A0A2V3VTN0_9BACI|nr:phenylalanine--tRNA ligase subunit beta [Pseudogracilibacillus auburnensis]PXW85263.1 phenylalanyl-tRNA synthetase beta subunit [Pseudogracilibacillus auburnensis]
MLVSLNWLKKYVDFGSLTPEQLAEKITKSGIEVDGIEYIVNEKSENIVVGYVKECEQHPNADKLKLCQVDVGEETLQIICGAPNVAQGQKVVVAKPGAVLPGNFKIKKVKLRGIESNGMICSLQELSVGERFIVPAFAEGIAVLPEDAVVGASVDELLNLDDAVLEFDLTPNRADALSMLGVAYEVAAILGEEISLPKPTIEAIDEQVSDYVKVSVDDPDLCPYYGASIIKDVTIGPAPLWMQNYLLAAGIRPINNVVDITNYVLLEYGQPLHAFDYDLLDSKEILVRRANNDEQMVTLDDQTRTLTDENLLITNGEKGVALAGVMGGANTEVNDDTKTILLEAAYFDGQTVRKAVKQTGLRSEASSRFEKGVDPNRVKEAGLRACELLVQYAGGKVIEGVAEFDQLDRGEKTVAMNASYVNKRLGTDISIEEMEEILRKLRFTFERNGEDFTVNIPTRRGDIIIFEDMLEEVARIFGYDHLPYTLPANASKPGGLTDEQLLKRRMKGYLQSVGLSEAITYSLLNQKDATRFVSPELSKDFIPVELSRPMSEDHQYLRLSLLPELLNRLTYNVARKQADVALYEAGSVFLSEEETLTKQPKEQLRLAGAITGKWLDHQWQQERKQVDFYVVKGIVEGLFGYLNRKVTFDQATVEGMHPGRCATISIDDQKIGFLGQIHPNLAKEKDLKETYVFDLDLAYILQTTEHELSYEPVPKYPSILRDIAFVVDKNVLAGDIKAEIERIGTPLVKRVEAFDVYTGENIADNEKSIAYNVHYQDPEKTLTDEEVDASFKEIVEAVSEKFGGYVRS